MKLLTTQDLVVQENSSGSVSSAAKSATATRSQQQSSPDSFVNDESENYCIEDSKTEIVEFKNLLPPYNQDKSNLFGVVVQALSDACSFEVSHKIEKRQL
ncbi:hypothetical protein NCY59_14125 [Acinetobacter radioresistens]|uniref:hypothetical protein n=1 Tax=Acinetobacter radioresistens TaxID=40216 RepID=UPI000C31E6BC|nr:hypothetical protein [Acinetobacter radioresistens]MCM1936522.1 hypothetical protein [Acinetobacter radioresistens]MCM1954155.1 hypothetical protein [Acinetobacter radioresistens]MCU4310119.1 hypothetical protein [Acinetobacter radioresistens]PKH36603.1 hypothetical protein BJF94_00060 [Acinetobacter radioresistens]